MAVQEEAFDIRLELRLVLHQLGEVRQILQCLREAEAIAEELNDDPRRGRVSAFLTNAYAQLGECRPSTRSRMASSIALSGQPAMRPGRTL